MSLALVVCALIIPTRMGALVQLLIDYFDAPENGARPPAGLPCPQLAPGLLALAGVYLLRAAVSYGKMQLLNRAVSRYFTCNLLHPHLRQNPAPARQLCRSHARRRYSLAHDGGRVPDRRLPAYRARHHHGRLFADSGHRGRDVFADPGSLSLAVIAFMPVSIWLSAKIAGRSETYFHQMFKQSGELYSVGGRSLHELRDDKGLL